MTMLLGNGSYTNTIPWADDTWDVPARIPALQRRNGNAWISSTMENGWLGVPQAMPPVLQAVALQTSAPVLGTPAITVPVPAPHPDLRATLNELLRAIHAAIPVIRRAMGILNELRKTYDLLAWIVGWIIFFWYYLRGH